MMLVSIMFMVFLARTVPAQSMAKPSCSGSKRRGGIKHGLKRGRRKLIKVAAAEHEWQYNQHQLEVTTSTQLIAEINFAVHMLQ